MVYLEADIVCSCMIIPLHAYMYKFVILMWPDVLYIVFVLYDFVNVFTHVTVGLLILH